MPCIRLVLCTSNSSRYSAADLEDPNGIWSRVPATLRNYSRYSEDVAFTLSLIHMPAIRRLSTPLNHFRVREITTEQMRLCTGGGRGRGREKERKGETIYIKIHVYLKVTLFAGTKVFVWICTRAQSLILVKIWNKPSWIWTFTNYHVHILLEYSCM